MTNSPARNGDCQSIDALREKIRSSLERNAEREADTAVREAVLDVLIERHPFDAPGGDGRATVRGDAGVLEHTCAFRAG